MSLWTVQNHMDGERKFDPVPIANPYRKRLLGWIPALLDAVSRGLCLREACRVANVSPSSVYHQRRVDDGFRGEWEKAAAIGTDLLEREAERRAYHGVERPVFYKGEQCGTIQDYSDPLMMFLLKARRPEVYRDMVEQGKGSAVTVSVQANVDAVSLLRGLITDNGDSKPEVIEGESLSPKIGTTGIGEVTNDDRGSPSSPTSPPITSPPSDGGHNGQVETRPSLNGYRPSTSDGMAHPEQ